MDIYFIYATTIFTLSYIAIISDKIHKTKVVIVGASLMLVCNVLTQHEAFYEEALGIDYNVIFLLIGMMIIVNIFSKTGIFQYLAIKSAKLAKGEPFRIMIIFALITAFASALLDNVTTVLLLVPIILLIAAELEIDPIPFIFSVIFASNIGGTATLIGDPPNIMIASKLSLTFMDFIYHLTPAILIILPFFFLMMKLMFGKGLHVKEELKQRIMNMDENDLIKDSRLLIKSLIVFVMVVTGFVLHGLLHLELATIALAGAGLLLLISGEDPEDVFRGVEWPTIFFFIGLFIIVGGIVKVGLVTKLSDAMVVLTNPSPDNMFITATVMIWLSAFCSAIIGNIPYVATMIPMTTEMANNVFSPDLGYETAINQAGMMPIWWSMALGACLGGNGSLVGASANVVAIGMAEKAGVSISFGKFLIYGIPVMMLTLVISMLYIWLRYYYLQIYI